MSDGSEIQYVYQYDNARKASRNYERQLDRFFSVDEWSTPWTPPHYVSQLHLSADEIYIACNEQSGIPKCQLLARYDNVNVRLFGRMRDEEVLDMIQTLDSKVSEDRIGN